MPTPRVRTPALLRAFEAYLDGKPLSECASVAGITPESLSQVITTQRWEAMRRDLLSAKLTQEKRSMEALAELQRQATARHLALTDAVLCEAEAMIRRLYESRDGSRKEHVQDLARISTLLTEMVKTQRLSLNLDTERLTQQTQADSMINAIREFMAGEDPKPPPATPASGELAAS